jgi:hypothetical protein
MDLKQEMQRAVYATIQEVLVEKLIDKTFEPPSTPTKTRISNAWELNPTGFLEFELTNPNGIIVYVQEYGRKPGVIKARYKKFLRFKSTNQRSRHTKKIPGNIAFEKDGYVYAKAVYHPGFEGRRFIDSLFNNNRILSEFENKINDRLQNIYERYFDEKLK